MAEKREGEKLSVLGPLGRGFEVPDGHSFPLLVAGGMGVAPLFFLAQAVMPRLIHFMIGVSSASELVAIERMGIHNIDVSIATDDGTLGHTGPVTDLLDAHLGQGGRQKDPFSVFACGPRPMLKKVAAITSQYRIPYQASLESVMACGLGACQGCAVKASPGEGRPFHHVCKDGPVFRAESIDWDAL
jgi:dihydroorotate dehydrogenase electron transfer subunit